MIRSRANHDKGRVPAPSALAMFVLAALFVAVRLLTAWLLRDEVNGDLAIVQLMVRDMVSTWRIPAFFYGQAYMGSLEPVANALFHLLFGRTDFGTELGTILFSVLMAWSVTRMARRMGGDWAAFAALALCVIGPLPFAHYAVSPRGGYGVLLFTTAGLLDIGGALIGEERREGRCRLAPAFFAGLLAGIGFWCNQLVFPAALSVALGVVFMAPRLLARARLWLGGILGFALGSAPFWIWNARNGWESFQMSGSMVFDRVIAARNLLLLVRERLPMLFGVNPPYASGTVAIVVVAAAILLPLLALRLYAPLPRRIHPDERQPPPDAKTQQALCWIYLAVFTGCFLCSHFAVFPTPRYLLPAVPVLAALSGAACTSMRFRSANALAVALLFILLFIQMPHLRTLAARGRDGAAQMAAYREAVAALDTNRADAVYCPFRHNSLNLVGDGQHAVFTDSDLERVPAFRFRAESATRPAVAYNFLGMARWIEASGGHAHQEKVAGVPIATDVTPPTAFVAEIPRETWLDAVDASGARCADALCDRDFSTAIALAGGECVVTVRFAAPTAICGFRALVSGFDASDACRAEWSPAPGAPFRRLAPDLPAVKAIWSGPRFYPDPARPVMESRFPAQTAAAVRLAFRSKSPDGTLRRVHELQLLAPAEGGAESESDWYAMRENLVGALHRHGVTRLYAGRWAANAVWLALRGSIWTNAGQDLQPKHTGAPAPRQRPIPVEIDGATALLTSSSGAAPMRAVLHRAGIAMRALPIGALGVLFIPETVQNVPFGRGVPTGIVFDENLSVFNPSAEWVTSRIARGGGASIWAPYETGRIPDSVPLLLNLLSRTTSESAAATVTAKLDLLTKPAIGELGSPASFSGRSGRQVWRGARLLAAPPRGDEVPAPGGRMLLRHYWSSPHGGLPEDGDLLAFVHFVGPGGYRFLDEFPLELPPEGADTVGSGQESVLWHIDREIPIPRDAPTGTYEMRVGLCDAAFRSRRLPLSTRLPHRRGAALVNPAFAIATENGQDRQP